VLKPWWPARRAGVARARGSPSLGEAPAIGELPIPWANDVLAGQGRQWVGGGNLKGALQVSRRILLLAGRAVADWRWWHAVGEAGAARRGAGTSHWEAGGRAARMARGRGSDFHYLLGLVAEGIVNGLLVAVGEFLDFVLEAEEVVLGEHAVFLLLLGGL